MVSDSEAGWRSPVGARGGDPGAAGECFVAVVCGGSGVRVAAGDCCVAAVCGGSGVRVVMPVVSVLTAVVCAEWW